MGSSDSIVITVNRGAVTEDLLIGDGLTIYAEVYWYETGKVNRLNIEIFTINDGDSLSLSISQRS